MNEVLTFDASAMLLVDICFTNYDLSLGYLCAETALSLTC